MHLEFHNPLLLWLLLLIPLIALWKGKAKNLAPSILFSNTTIAKKISHKKPSSPTKILLTLRLLSLSLIIVALARPQFGKNLSYTEASGIDIVLALDLSSSMLGLDLAHKSELKTRVDVSKEVIREFIEQRHNDRIGLIAFAGHPYLVSPLTLNHDWLINNLDRLQLGLIEDGTAIGDAIAMSVNRLKNLPSKSRVIILLTDGANNAGKIAPLNAAEAAAAFNTKVYTIAVGKEGIIPSLLMDSNKNILKDNHGRFLIGNVHSSLDIKTLVEISDITHAKSYKATNLEELNDIYREINNLEKTDIKFKTHSNYKEAFMIPLLAALILLGIEYLLANSRFRKLP